jgi:2-dehydropantoate 2-reductase
MDASLLILGTGAMACLFAARLAAAGARVTMLGSWEEGLEALRKHGVRLIETEGTEGFYAVGAVNDPNLCRGLPYALVLVKSWQTQRAARQLAECLPQDGLALTLQNGLNNYQTLANALGEERVALGVTTSGAYLEQAGVVRAVGSAVVSLGVHPRLSPLADMLEKAGFKVTIETDLRTLVWGKLVINAAINPLTALLRVPNGELLERPTARALMGMTALETATIAKAQGISLPYPDAVAAVEEVARRTAENYSSMLRDVLRGAPTEVDAINGAVVHTGEQIRMPTPLNQALFLLVKAMVYSHIAQTGALNPIAPSFT